MFILLINVKMPSIVGIVTILRIEISCSDELSMKKSFITLGQVFKASALYVNMETCPGPLVQHCEIFCKFVFLRGLYFRETSHMRNFVKIKPSRNGKITLSFIETYFAIISESTVYNQNLRIISISVVPGTNVIHSFRGVYFHSQCHCLFLTLLSDLQTM